MATTTTTANTKTTNTYNKDFSAADAYKVDKTNAAYNPELQKAGQQSISEYATNRGYDSPYTYNDLLNNIYNPGVEAQYDADVYGTQVAQNAYDQSLNAMNRAAIDAIRSETAGAVASGASRGVTDANVLKSILGLQQESVADATDLAQQYRQAEVDRGVNLAQALVDVSDTSWDRQNAIDAETLQLFDRMQTAYDNKYTADAGLASTMYASDADIYNNFLTTLANQVLSEETNATSVTESPDVASSGSIITTTDNFTYTPRETPLNSTNVATEEALKDTADGKAYSSVTGAQAAADKLNGGSKTGTAAQYIVSEKRGKNIDGNNSKYFVVIKNPNYVETKTVPGTDIKYTKVVEVPNPKGNGSQFKYYNGDELVYTSRFQTTNGTMTMTK